MSWRILGKLRGPFLAGCVLICTALLLGGCSKPPGNVKGTVTYKGKPLPNGTIVYWASADNSTHSAEIEEGAYRVVNIPAGPAKITVVTEEPRELGIPVAMDASKMGSQSGAKLAADPNAKKKQTGGMPHGPDKGAGSAKKSSSKFVAIPEIYADPEKSGLTFTVKSGENKNDISLQ